MAVQRFKDANGNWIIIGGGGGGIGEVEHEMSDTSENAVQNKVIKRYVDNEVEDAKAYSEEKADNAEAAAKQYADSNKVAKVEGKQLSTEDFTTTLKQKLEGLTNYDDADVRSTITELQNSLDAIVNGDATSAIDSIQEILAFLSTITDTQTLAGIVADLKQYVDDKVASGITEKKEVYIGSEEPPVGAKVWIDPQGTPSSPSAGVEVIDNLESDSTTAALSANQGRVLKEMISFVRMIHPVIEGMPYTEEQRAYNIETFALAKANSPCLYYVNGTPLTIYTATTNTVSFLGFSWAVGGGKEQFVVSTLILNEDGSLGMDMKSFNMTSLKQ